MYSNSNTLRKSYINSILVIIFHTCFCNINELVILTFIHVHSMLFFKKNMSNQATDNYLYKVVLLYVTF